MKKRTEGKYKADITCPEIYKYYKKNLDIIVTLNGDKTKGLYNIKEEKHNRILKKLNNGLIELLIKDSYEFKIPYGGVLSIKKKKIKVKFDENGKLKKKFLGVNWGETNKLWNNDPDAKAKKTLVYYTNEHTNGYKMHFYWNKRNLNIKNKYLYQFIATRHNKRYLGDCINNLNLNFYEIKTPKWKIKNKE